MTCMLQNYAVGVTKLKWIPLESKGFLVKTIWKVYVPTGMAFFLGCVTLDKTLSTDNLKKLKVGHYGLVLYAMLHGHEHGHGHGHDTDTGIQQFLKNKDTTQRGHGG